MTKPERRELEFASLDEVLEDIESLAANETRTTGNHSFAEIIRHLAITNEMVTGKFVPPKLPLFMRLAMPFIRNRILSGPVNPGFKLPNHMEEFFWLNEVTSVDDAITRFRSSIELVREKGLLPFHPIFGKSSNEQTSALLLKHAAMHLSFVDSA